ncbi:carbohydrate kinase family protein [Paenibacillus sp. OAS669]|uniref:carbohydrate kinase family protein n=1 Tax=Paenibacillus sp. OAS669 TaxID=2663821 RepID=UPI0019EF403F|nr:carbohydrate kinase family protein [Paenibacillus sp. OAS669]MBE1440985.1 sugar/nucleoside kinase (ribokinase family) [Paenibacillus sp. OAS669]
MKTDEMDVIVAGHICLDIIPAMEETHAGTSAFFAPGKLVNIGPAILSTGGAVSNTGIALHRLGGKVKLMGKIGTDPFGETILTILRQHSPALADGMIIAPHEHSSYSIVISPPHRDRTFLHSTGANDSYSAADLTPAHLQDARLFHFGYPPLMRKMYENQGEELALLLKKAKDHDLTVSLDMARPDPDSAAGKVDWTAVLTHALPYVDIFMPSFEEILYMLQRERFERLLGEAPDGNLLSYAADGGLLSEMSEQLLQMGTAIAAIKLGEHGLYVRTTSNADRLRAMGPCAPEQAMAEHWLGCEMLTACYEVDAVGTTGAGDCTIAGFLTGLLRGLSLKESLHAAVGAGAFNVEWADATSGIPSWQEVWERIGRGWAKRGMKLDLTGWSLLEPGLWVGPHHQFYVEGQE